MIVKQEIRVSLNCVSREEQQDLRDYLEANCWKWEEKTLKQEDN